MGRVWGGRRTGHYIIVRSEDPPRFWTQIACLALVVLVLLLMTWLRIRPCF